MSSELEKYEQRQVLSQLQKARDYMHSALLTVKAQNLGGTEADDLQAAIDALVVAETSIKAAYVA